MTSVVLASSMPTSRYEATPKKTGAYKTEGFFSAGKKEITSAALKDIRRANSNEGFERIVFDMDSQASLPYFQVQYIPNESRIVVSIWSNVQYEFDSNRIRKAFSKSKNIKKVNIVPRVEDGLAIIEMVIADQKKPLKFESFYLSKPNRIIIDLL